MKKIFIATLVGAALAATAFALPADLVVISNKEVAPDEEAGLYYLGPAVGGFLYNGSSAALSYVAPYRLLDRDAARKDYYLVWVPGGGVAASAFEHLGSAAAVSDEEILVGLDPAVDAEELRDIDRRVELVKLEPATPLEGRLDAEEPPTQKDAEIEAAVNTISADEFALYVLALQDYVTRYTPTSGYAAARDYTNAFFTAQDLSVTLFPFDYRGVTYHNVIAERRGVVAPDEIIIIGGHLDSTSPREYRETLAPGADDNASGVVVAMAAARAFKEFDFDRTVRYCAFGGEEQGLYGSRAYALHCRNNNENLIAMLNADMVAYDEENGGRDDFSIAYRSDEWLLTYLQAVGGLYGNQLIYDHQEFTGSDHYSFWLYGYSAVGAIEGSPGVGGGTSYPYYHTIYDTLDKLHPNLAARFTRDYAAMFAHLAKSPSTGVEGPPAERRGVPRARPVVRVYPNPYYYDAVGGICFEGLATPAAITVYDLAGRRVAAWTVAGGRDSSVWTPAGDDGDSLAPGVYIYRVEGQELRKAGKIVVAE